MNIPEYDQCNSEKFDKAIEFLTPEQVRSFKSYFFGSLSVKVPPDVWNHSLETAMMCLERESQ